MVSIGEILMIISIDSMLLLVIGGILIIASVDSSK